MTDEPFWKLLARTRNERHLSQSRLAARAGYDHSYVSRLESDSRTPTREAVIALATAMFCSEERTDELLMAAGFMPLNDAALLGSEPYLVSVHAILSDPKVPPDVRGDLRAAVQMAERREPDIYKVPLASASIVVRVNHVDSSWVDNLSINAKGFIDLFGARCFVQIKRLEGKDLPDRASNTRPMALEIQLVGVAEDDVRRAAS